VKLLIIAGPYEADRIRRAAVLAGLEAVAVEAGESLSGWITATRPDVIILAPQIISPDPISALAKVLAVPRGRVPIFVVGDADEQDQLQPLADGFFVRPVAPEDLFARARDATARATPRSLDDAGSGPNGGGSGPHQPGSGPHESPSGRFGASAISAGGTARPPSLKPLIAARPASLGLQTGDTNVDPATPKTRGAGASVSSSAGSGPRVSTLFDRLAENIEADFDAEIRDVVRAVGVLRQAKSPAVEDDGLEELKDESSQKTLEVPQTVVAAASDPPVPPPATPGPTFRVAVAAPDLAPAPTPGGDEVELDLPSLLARMYLSRLSGRLTLRHGGVQKFVVFERGHPVQAGSNRVEDRMGDMLVRHGRFTAQQIAMCGAEVSSSGRRLGAVLVDRGLLKATELSLVVRRHYEEIIYSLFTWDHGAWNLGTDSSAAAEKILMSQHPAALILEGIRRKYRADRSVTGLGGAGCVLRLRLTTGASDLLEKMGVSSDERNLILLFDGVRSLDEIRALTGAPAERLFGVAWALFVLERLDVVAGAAHETHPTTGVTSSPESIDRAMVQALYALVIDGDYFQILGVSRDASAQEITRAHELRLAELTPALLHPNVAAQLDPELAEIRVVLSEAARLLVDDRLRGQYRAHLRPAPAADVPTESATP
jgi:CheY-like chemotaxis protein